MQSLGAGEQETPMIRKHLSCSLNRGAIEKARHGETTAKIGSYQTHSESTITKCFGQVST